MKIGRYDTLGPIDHHLPGDLNEEAGPESKTVATPLRRSLHLGKKTWEAVGHYKLTM